MMSDDSRREIILRAIVTARLLWGFLWLLPTLEPTAPPFLCLPARRRRQVLSSCLLDLRVTHARSSSSWVWAFVQPQRLGIFNIHNSVVKCLLAWNVEISYIGKELLLIPRRPEVRSQHSHVENRLIALNPKLHPIDQLRPQMKLKLRNGDTSIPSLADLHR